MSHTIPKVKILAFYKDGTSVELNFDNLTEFNFGNAYSPFKCSLELGSLDEEFWTKIINDLIIGNFHEFFLTAEVITKEKTFTILDNIKFKNMTFEVFISKDGEPPTALFSFRD